MNWQIDPAHSHIAFSVRHMMVAKVRGEFTRFDGAITLDEGRPDRTQVSIRIDAASIDTRLEARDQHLRSADFLDAEVYPSVDFVSRQVELLGSDRARLEGDLTIRGVSRPVVLDVEYSGQAQSPWGTTSAGFSATTRLRRKDWGLNWNQALETGGWLVGDEITVTIELELVKKPEEMETVAVPAQPAVQPELVPELVPA
jgi:polyisoprenoid-binding protein YceI